MPGENKSAAGDDPGVIAGETRHPDGQRAFHGGQRAVGVVQRIETGHRQAGGLRADAQHACAVAGQRCGNLAQRLVAHFGGELLFLASCFAAGAQQRRARIARAVASGMPRDHVAREFGVSQPPIKRALRDARSAPPPAVHPALLKGYARA
ncbi:hypothetical protein G6F64_013548 [Rhizopus arrhizus]|uniref:Uncharacterized protein n=1 Tax=Rhizopus oryzae TaxID=64495 RepID=A0A9P7BKN4_RHIOR|nr:hypothetical protein G6F64_013548 [Rhizopus arrhizus]